MRNPPLIIRLAALIFILGAPLGQAQSPSQFPRQHLQTGDIVLLGNDSAWGFVARRFADVDSRWSHVGMVIHDGEDASVVHMDGSPLGGRIRRESVSAFTSEARYVQVVRPAFDSRQRAWVGDWLVDHLKRDTAFDTRFHLDQDPAMYCSELVWRALDHVAMTPGDDSLPRVAGRAYVPVDRLTTLGRTLGEREWMPSVVAGAR